ncbi:DUF6624 domain-containing protein [uncultured Parabacteroides sp.]|uniref:DUF6624 domain-containing protein n=1 Tax=uncultured Parabacteroides sp. TaxID=512312 RepID=UPI00280571FC|nr:DUF6624 domain-containing protein [uncultured Parabacteroides sp.]MBD9166967.1 hypothetical protein [Parabacteroides johnsonii]
MKSRILLALLLNVSCCCMAQESLSVDSMLCAIRDKDQSIRQKIMPMLASGNQDSIMAVVVQMNMIDKENQTFVFGLLDNQGWPDGLSDKANSAIFLVIDHAEFAAQEKYYPVVKEKAEQGIIGKEDAATLQDRILMKKGEMQVYGTQTTRVVINGENINYLWPVKNPDQLDKLRKEVNLPPIAEYIAVFEKQGMKLVWDKSLSVDDLKAKMIQK